MSSAGCERLSTNFQNGFSSAKSICRSISQIAYYGSDLKEAHLPFNFSLLETRWHARRIAKLIDSYEAALPEGGWPNWVLGNHDRRQNRATRVGSAQARIAAMLLLTLRGTPTVYYGDEIGLVQAPIPPDRIHDPLARNVPGLNLGRDGASNSDAMER